MLRRTLVQIRERGTHSLVRYIYQAKRIISNMASVSQKEAGPVIDGRGQHLQKGGRKEKGT